MFQDFDHGPTEDPTGPTVKKAATVFKTCLERQECRDDVDSVHKLSQALAYMCRESLRKSWRYDKEFPSEHEDIIHDYEKRFQK
jgi:hypothetical protein